jgi:hypothetical protein
MHSTWNANTLDQGFGDHKMMVGELIHADAAKNALKNGILDV